MRSISLPPRLSLSFCSPPLCQFTLAVTSRVVHRYSVCLHRLRLRASYPPSRRPPSRVCTNSLEQTEGGKTHDPHVSETWKKGTSLDQTAPISLKVYGVNAVDYFITAVSASDQARVSSLYFDDTKNARGRRDQLASHA